MATSRRSKALAPADLLAVEKPAPRKAVSRPRAVPARDVRTLSLPFLMVDPAPRNRLLVTAITWSIVLHAVALAIRFSPIELPKFEHDALPMQVALVNAKTTAKPTKADVLAQANLDGGGNTDENRHAKTPLPVLPRDSNSNDLAVATQKVEDLERQTKEMLTQLKANAAVARAQPAPIDAPQDVQLPSASELMQKTLEAMRLEAEIAKDMDAYQKRPKRRFLGARAQEYRFARYVEDWRLKVERVGNLNYPEVARVQKLYGSLLLTVGIRSDGAIESIMVDRSSGQKILDLAATKIVEMGAPYSTFPPDVKRDTDILYITRTWTFAPGDSLSSQ
jgi:periplasmic protein TonB